MTLEESGTGDQHLLKLPCAVVATSIDCNGRICSRPFDVSSLEREFLIVRPAVLYYNGTATRSGYPNSTKSNALFAFGLRLEYPDD